MTNVNIEAIAFEYVPRKLQRYDTAGDWFMGSNNVLYIRTDEAIGTPDGFLIALHELVEAYLCMSRGITMKMVDDFDIGFKGEGEPGDDPSAPYRREHRFAMLIEHLVAHEIGISGYGRVE